jgi:hypothetical protein
LFDCFPTIASFSAVQKLTQASLTDLNLTGNILLGQRILANSLLDAMDDRRLGGRAEDGESSRDRSVFVNNAVIVVLFGDTLIFAGLAQQPSVTGALVAVGTERVVLQDSTTLGDVVFAIASGAALATEQTSSAARCSGVTSSAFMGRASPSRASDEGTLGKTALVIRLGAEATEY